VPSGRPVSRVSAFGQERTFQADVLVLRSLRKAGGYNDVTANNGHTTSVMASAQTLGHDKPRRRSMRHREMDAPITRTTGNRRDGSRIVASITMIIEGTSSTPLHTLSANALLDPPVSFPTGFARRHRALQVRTCYQGPPTTTVANAYAAVRDSIRLAWSNPNTTIMAKLTKATATSKRITLFRLTSPLPADDPLSPHVGMVSRHAECLLRSGSGHREPRATVRFRPIADIRLLPIRPLWGGRRKSV
jgi:hypothetical protein